MTGPHSFGQHTLRLPSATTCSHCSLCFMQGSVQQRVQATPRIRVESTKRSQSMAVSWYVRSWQRSDSGHSYYILAMKLSKWFVSMLTIHSRQEWHLPASHVAIQLCVQSAHQAVGHSKPFHPYSQAREEIGHFCLLGSPTFLYAQSHLGLLLQ